MYHENVQLLRVRRQKVKYFRKNHVLIHCTINFEKMFLSR